jgi:hypothetical protein
MDNESFLDMLAERGGAIHVSGIAGYDNGRGFVTLLMHDLEAGSETTARYANMTWKDLRKHKIPIVADFNNSRGVPMLFEQDASGGRRVDASDSLVNWFSDVDPRELYRAVWEALDAGSFKSLGLSFG